MGGQPLGTHLLLTGNKGGSSYSGIGGKGKRDCTTSHNFDGGGLDRTYIIEYMDYDSAINTVTCDIQNTYTDICDFCNNVDITTGPSQLDIRSQTKFEKLFFADVQGPFDVESLEGSVYKFGIIEVTTRFLG